MAAGDPESLARRGAGRARDPFRRVRRAVRGYVLRAIAPFAGDGTAPLPDLRACRRILLVSVNERLGNSLLPTAPVAALAAALPEAELDFVGGPLAPALLRGLGVRTVHTVRRSDPWQPWRLLRLVRRLRAARYDAAIHLAGSTGSLGAFLVGTSGAAHRIGVRRPDGNVYFTSALEAPPDVHKVDELHALVRQLGVEGGGERRIALSPDERAEGAARLARELGADAAPVAIFVGGRARKGKAWPLAAFAKVAEGLRAQHLPLVVFLGPEELAREPEIRAALGEALYVAEPDVRKVAALVSCCRAALSPDSGPMHLAIAAGTPTVAIFVRENFDRWGPQAAQGRVLYDPSGTRFGEALDAILKLVPVSVVSACARARPRPSRGRPRGGRGRSSAWRCGPRGR